MQDILIKSNINMNTLIHVDVLIDEEGLFAVHTDWMDSIFHHKISVRYIVLWQGGDSFLQCGGSSSDLLKHNI